MQFQSVGDNLVLSQPVLRGYWSHPDIHLDIRPARVCVFSPLQEIVFVPRDPGGHNANNHRMYVPLFTNISYIRRNLTHYQTVTFITRTYALYDRNRAVLIGLASLGFAAVGVGSVSRGTRPSKIRCSLAKVK